MITCFACQRSQALSERVGFRQECEHCHHDLHVCRNCLHYDTKSYNDCKESAAERQTDKERANYCEYFAAKSVDPHAATVDHRAELLKAAEALFKKKSEE